MIPYKLHSSAQLPAKAHSDDAAYDLHSCEDATIPAGLWAIVDTGIRVAIPECYAGLILPRSGLAARTGITVLNAPGLIDPGYRGRIKVELINHADVEQRIPAGTRIAQLLITPTVDVEFVEVDGFDTTTRGENGFGSTGQ